ncbi:hypothetical protein ALC53_00340 [Atta colombica]|uniref:Uncharacterized protein n=1 Tax=Atta colombica TaxID=520822 RepID=A0A195BX00_9HYME|nr:hypothetical protein ALC53_00340 [Atta colombica]
MVENLHDRNRNIACQATDKLRNYNKSYYDKHHKTSFVYKPYIIQDNSGFNVTQKSYNSILSPD